MDHNTVNMILAAFRYKPSEKRHKLLTEDRAFPLDHVCQTRLLYILKMNPALVCSVKQCSRKTCFGSHLNLKVSCAEIFHQTLDLSLCPKATRLIYSVQLLKALTATFTSE